MANFANSFGRDINWNAIGKTSHLTPAIQQHLTNVYTTLAATILSAAVGSVVATIFRLQSSLYFLAGIGLMFWLHFVPKHEMQKRLAILLGFGFVQGISLSPMINHVADIDPSIITTAFLGTTIIFGCFSGCAIYAQRRSYLYLGGFISSALSIMAVTSLANIFFRSAVTFNALLYAGLAVFSAFVIFDTQLIIEKAASGHKDFVMDGLELFLDFVNIFVRLMIILSKDKKKKNNSNR